MLGRTRGTRDERGAVFVEKLIVYLPLLLTFFAVWELAELSAAQLVVQRASAAAGRAAMVVLPDDPAYYDGEATGSYDGQRRGDIELAAGMILSSNPRLKSDFDVEIDDVPTTLGGEFEVSVAANFDCGPVSIVCGLGDAVELNSTTVHAYQGVKYEYTAPSDVGGGSQALSGEEGGSRLRTRNNGEGSSGGAGGNVPACKKIDPRTQSCGEKHVLDAIHDRMGKLGVGSCDGFIEQIKNNTSRVREGQIRCVSQAEAEKLMAKDLHQRDQDKYGSSCRCTPNDLGDYNQSAQSNIRGNACRQFTTLDDKIIIIAGADGNCDPEESDILHETIHIMSGPGGKTPIQGANNALNEAITQVITEDAFPDAKPAYEDGAAGDWKKCIKKIYGGDKKAICETYFGMDGDALARAAVARARTKGLPFSLKNKSDEELIVEFQKYNIRQWQNLVCPK